MRSRWRVSFAAIAVVGAATAAHATSDVCTEVDKSLAGWSEDGKTWAVYEAWSDDSTKVLKVTNAKEEELAVVGLEDGDFNCSSPTIWISIKPTRKYAAVQRIDIAKHSELKAFKLDRVRAKWRKDFKAGFEIRKRGTRAFQNFAGSYAPDGGEDRRCENLELVRKVDSKVLARFPGKCKRRNDVDAYGKVHGGYLHPNGKYILIKLTRASSWWRTFESDGEEDRVPEGEVWTGFQLVEVPPVTKPK